MKISEISPGDILWQSTNGKLRMMVAATPRKGFHPPSPGFTEVESGSDGLYMEAAAGFLHSTMAAAANKAEEYIKSERSRLDSLSYSLAEFMEDHPDD